MQLSKQHLGIIYAVSAAALFSLKPVLVKLIYVYGLDTTTLLAWRMIISMPIYLSIGLIIWLKNTDRNNYITNNKQWFIRATLIGLLGYYLAAWLDLKGLQSITAQLERLILFSYPSIVAILSSLILKQALGKNTLLALLLSYLGIAVIIASDWQQLGEGVLAGSLWVFLAAVSFSLYIVLSKPVIDQIGGKEFTVLAMVSSSILALIHFFSTHPIKDLIIPMPAFWLAFIMAILTTVIPTFLIAAAVSNLGPTKTAIAGTFGPVMTSIFAVILLDEFFGWPQVFGMAMVILAVKIMQSKSTQTV